MQKKYKHRKTALTVKDTDSYKRRMVLELKDCEIGKYYDVEEINYDLFAIIHKKICTFALKLFLI